MASGKVARLLGPGDVVNNLNSTATDKPLSAAQGKELNDKIATTGIQFHDKGGVSWGNSVNIARPTNAAVLLFGGRQGIGFIVYIPKNTTEVAPIGSMDALEEITATTTAITLTAKSSGYGSTLNYEYLVFT